MTFDEFKNNVEKWAADRGIYEHSTALAQAMKAGSEAGELVDAVIKNNHNELVDSLGDVATCLVNYAAMRGFMLAEPTPALGIVRRQPDALAVSIFREISRVMESELLGDKYSNVYAGYAMDCMNQLCAAMDIDFLDCCSAAWDQIKDRRGYMVAGGAFVKE